MLLHVRPDGPPRRRLHRPRGLTVTPTLTGAFAGQGGLLGRAVELGHVLDGDDHPHLDDLLRGRLHDRRRAGAAQESRHLAHGADGGGQADALGRPGQQGVEPLQGEREVDASFGGGDRVHLVDDDRLDPAQRVTCPAGEQQVERLGGGDQDVGGIGGEAAAVLRGGVAGPDGHGDLGDGQAHAPGGLLEARERGSEVALDVDRQRLQRRHIDDAALPRRALPSRPGLPLPSPCL